jgi:hypothetical protein
MATLNAEKPMARRGDTRRDDITIRINAEVVRKARIVADFEGKSLAGYVSDALGPIVDADLARHSRQVLESEKHRPGPKGAK